MVTPLQALLAGFMGGVGAQVARLPAMGLEKALLEPLSRNLFRRNAARITPHLARLFDLLDPLMPMQVANLTPEELESWVRGQLEALTGEEWPDPADLEPFWQTYDPRINARKTHQFLLPVQQRTAPVGRDPAPGGTHARVAAAG